MKINFNNIQACDLVFTTSLSPIADMIRIKEAGLKNIFNTRISTHVGIVVPIGTSDIPVYSIGEMLGDGLHLSSFSTYLDKGYIGDRIVDIKRFKPFTGKVSTALITKTVLTWWNDGKKYDYAGLLKYVLPFLNDKDSKFYCSEMIGWLAINLLNKEILDTKRPKNDTITPYDIQKSKLLTSVNGWRI